ncbi:hypothetical protein OE88DRAFT_1642017 [Heliocybe sulcata]|uniref:Uncharacterized protein n=1 Tax=Heliocybe sulcata TaxID=5364 RepID=A0A5C3NCR0_9AGAM|nr:hypothetical protein OE88DRAFT_1642017 [Heliocybe sulcata]
MPPSSVSHRTRTSSPPLSTIGSSQAFTLGQQPKINIVTRLAVEGKAKHGYDGAEIRMYLKLTMPRDSVTPGSTIALFPEENIKIVNSQVHPIDSNSVPYNFSSTTCPLLHSAARALNLPARSSQSYMSLFGLSAPSTPIVGSSSRRAAHNAHIPPLDERYTGQVLVSGYQVSYVLPREFPPSSRLNGIDELESRIAMSRSPGSTHRARRTSVSEKNVIQFMAAIDLWVPLLTKPPRAPYLLSIPTPRCLSNHIKLRIFPPNSSASASLHSLSSAEEDPGSWDLTADPHVTRNASSKASRASSYTHFADDESSDSSTAGFSDGCGIQGTFPSTEQVRVRWATPMKTVEGDGRRRVGVRDVKGEMTAVVLGKGRDKTGEGVVMKLEYSGTCQGVWFPGVATLLGLDVTLDGQGSDVSWLPGADARWFIDGGRGFTGYDAGSPPSMVSRPSSLEVPDVSVSSASPFKPNVRQSSSSSSLLRAPLPIQNVPDYSFESAPSSAPSSGMLTSSDSLAEGSSRLSSVNGIVPPQDDPSRPPLAPLTLHININELLPPAKNMFTFNISGIVLVKSRPSPFSYNSPSSSVSGSDAEGDVDPVAIPRFRVPAADAEMISTVVRNDVDGATVDVYNSTGDLRDAQTRRTVLQRGAAAKCGIEGGRVALRYLAAVPRTPARTRKVSAISHRTPSQASSPTMSVVQATPMAMRPERDGPLIIPWVAVTVTPLSNGIDLPNAYAVRVVLPAPTDDESEWLEFGLRQQPLDDPARSDDQEKRDIDSKPPRVEVVSASVEGVSVRFETTVAVRQDLSSSLSSLVMPSQQLRGDEWVSWVKVHVGAAGGSKVQVDYVIRNQEERTPESVKRKGKQKAKETSHLHVCLPMFALPVGCLDVNVEAAYGFDILSMESNLTHQQSNVRGRRLLRYSMEELFCPGLTIDIISTRQTSPLSGLKSTRSVMVTVPAVVCLILLICLLTANSELRQLRRSLGKCSASLELEAAPDPVTVTYTQTVLINTQSHRWFAAPTSATLRIDQILEPPVPPPTNSSPGDMREGNSTPSMPTSASSITHAASTTYAIVRSHPIHFKWPEEYDLHSAGRATMDAVAGGLGVVWQLLRRVYHYPLDPP